MPIETFSEGGGFPSGDGAAGNLFRPPVMLRVAVLFSVVAGRRAHFVRVAGEFIPRRGCGLDILPPAGTPS